MNTYWRKANGPWSNEADNETWHAHGFTCEIKRNESMGHLCGYVHIPEEHPWYEESYDDIGVDVHGGLTFSARCKTSGGWMVGFDCAHIGDATPMSRALPFDHIDYTTSGTYRDWAYVKAETERLAEQAAKRWVEERKLVANGRRKKINEKELIAALRRFRDMVAGIERDIAGHSDTVAEADEAIETLTTVKEQDQ